MLGRLRPYRRRWKPLVDFERGKTKPYASTLERIYAALEGQGVEFINGDTPGVRLKGRQE